MGKNGKWEQDVTAASGVVEVDKENQLLNVILENATVAAYEGGGSNKTMRRTFSRQLTFQIDYGRGFNANRVSRKDKYLTAMELLARMSLDKKRGVDTTELEVELNQRVALALAPIAFLLLGMPLAVRTSRRETSVGLFLSVLLAGLTSERSLFRTHCGNPRNCSRSISSGSPLPCIRYSGRFISSRSQNADFLF